VLKCPGLDKRYWRPEDVFNVNCPACGEAVEFFRTDITRKCPSCGQRFRNPKLNLACAEWCEYGDVCLGISRPPTS